jgi:hypothetical protein
VKILGVGLAIALLSGCASHPKIDSVGPDTYTVTFADNGWLTQGDTNAVKAMSAATAYCDQWPLPAHPNENLILQLGVRPLL